MATSCDHMDHVRTQLPYAVAVAVVSVVLGDIGTAYGLPAWVALGGGGLALYLLLLRFGVRVGEAAPREAGPPLPEEIPE